MHAGSSGPVGALSALAGTTAPAKAIPTSVAATAVLVIAPRIFEAIAQFIRRSLQSPLIVAPRLSVRT
jgi:hypothetical protein